MELLANILRPKKLNEVIGQDNLIGKDKIIYNMVKNKKIFSMILHGHPGVGKNSIASAIIHELGLPYRELNAVINKKQDFDIVIEEAKMNGEMILVIDEIHRMNKDKQDILLPHIESGLLIIIGLTTSNPYHSINPAIRSRCQIFELKDLTQDDIIKGIKRAVKTLENIKINAESISYIASLSGCDMRNALTLLDVAYNASKDHNITLDLLKNIDSKPYFIADKNEDAHYDVISAFQKSIRGSDVNAAIHYLARLIESGDLDSLFRRLTVIAYEDIGLANPGIGPKVIAAIEAVNSLGIDEGRIPLSVVVIEMALSPKSNSALMAIDAALNDIRKNYTGSVPNHIKTTSKDYLYPHNYPKYWVKQQYLPDILQNKVYYHPKKNKYEYNLDRVNKEMKK